MTFPYCAIDSSFTKFDLSKKNDETCCIEGTNYSKYGTPYYLHGRSLLFKVSPTNKIEWVKSIFNRNFEYNSYSNQNAGVLKQTNDKGLICAISGRVAKLDDKGNTEWEIYFDRDTIPGIKKSDFLNGAATSDIQECKDGSYILLLNACFSLMKISADGKPLWLKSTVFDEFDPIIVNFTYGMKEIPKDTFFVNSIQWHRGGGKYVDTYNIYETEDGGYMAIGQSKLGGRNAYTKLQGKELENKYIYTHKPEYLRIFPNIIYLADWQFRKDMDAIDPPILMKRGIHTVLVRTDSLGNVVWKMRFGEGSCYYPSNLIKLANNKWLVRIRDCNKSGAFPVFYTVNDNGEILKKQNISTYDCDPWDMAMAPDSGFYLFEQNVVTKTDKNLDIQWQRALGGTATYQFQHAVLNNGVICPEDGIFYKYDQYGNTIVDEEPTIDSISVYTIIEKDPFHDYIAFAENIVHFFLSINTRYFLEKQAILLIEKKKENGIKRIYERKYISEERFNCPDCEKEDLIYFINTSIGQKIKYLPSGKYRDKRDLDNYERWIFDISKPMPINALMIDARDITSPYANESNSKKLKFDGPANKLEIRSIYGFSQLVIKGLEEGEYRYTLKLPNGKKITSGKFEIK